MSEQTFFAAVMVGAIVEKKIADEFAEKCKPYDSADVIEAFINSVASGDLKVTVTEGKTDGTKKA